MIREEFFIFGKERTLLHVTDCAQVHNTRIHIILKMKWDVQGFSNKFKARVVAGVHHQVIKLDYGAVYAPVVSLIICALMLIMCFTMGWSLKHVDVTAKIFNAEIDRELYMQYPYNLPRCKLAKTIYRLHKPLYGHKLTTPLISKTPFLTTDMGYTNLTTDCSVFLKRRQFGRISIIHAYVGDLMVMSSNGQCLRINIDLFLDEF